MLRLMVFSLLICGCVQPLRRPRLPVTTQPFGKMPDGTPVEVFTLSDGTVEAQIISYGGILVSLKAPDRNGNSADVARALMILTDTSPTALREGAHFLARWWGATRIESRLGRLN